MKALHIASLALWVGALIGQPLLLARHRRAEEQEEFARVRRFAHFSYIGVTTPAAVIAVGSGTALIFLREVFEPWLYLKLLVVGLLVMFHALVGHLNVKVGEESGRFRPPRGLPLTMLVVATSTVILLLVLAKPDLSGFQFPSWLTAPLGRPLPVNEVPI